MSKVKGKQIASSPDGIDTGNINANAVTAAKVGSDVVIAAGTNAFTGDQSHGGFKITNLGTPTSGTDAATKAYVDAARQGLAVKDPCIAMSTTNVGTMSGLAQTLDGIAIDTIGYRVFLTGQSTATQNGIWVAASGAWTRPLDFATGAHVAGAFTFIEEGTVHDNEGWVCTTNPPTDIVDTNNLAFAKFSYTSVLVFRNGLAQTGTNVDVVPHDGALVATNGDLAVNYTLAGALATLDGGAASAGTGASLAHGDHKHPITTGTPVAVGTANAAGSGPGLAMFDHVHDSLVSSVSNKQMTASVTSSDGDSATATTVVAANGLSGFVYLLVNGVMMRVGDGVKTKDAYISGDGGTTARAFSAIAAADTIRWNGSIAGFQLAATDVLDLIYSTF